MAGLRTGIRRRYQELSKALDERGRRMFAAEEARAYGTTVLAWSPRLRESHRSTIVHGVREIKEKVQVGSGRIRQAGSGRKTKCFENRTLLPDLERLVEPTFEAIRCDYYAGHPRCLRHLARVLKARDHSTADSSTDTG